MCSNCSGDYEGRIHGLPARGSHNYSHMWRERPEGPTQVERLAYPKCALLTGEDRLQQLLASAYAQYMIHVEAKG